MKDNTERLVSDFRFAALPQHLRGLTPMGKVTEAGARVLEKYNGLAIEYISNPLVYGVQFRNIGKVEHKTLLRLFLGGHVRVFRKDGPLGTRHIGGDAKFHYVVYSANRLLLDSFDSMNPFDK